jgi:hypothetical protein
VDIVFSSWSSIVNDRGVRDSRVVYYAGVDSVGKYEGGLLLVFSRVLRKSGSLQDSALRSD